MVSRRTALVLALLLSACRPGAEPPPHQAEIASWAEAAGYKLEPFAQCTGIEEDAFGALGSVCWQMRRRIADRGTELYPRLQLTLSVFSDEAAAQARMARFREVPRALRGEAAKTYPLRAGFRLGSRVMVVSTDARVFDADVGRAAGELAEKLSGTELTCWMKCRSKPEK